MRCKTFQRKTKERVIVICIFSNRKVDSCGFLEIFFYFIFMYTSIEKKFGTLIHLSNVVFIYLLYSLPFLLLLCV
jgi:hypothetical protein